MTKTTKTLRAIKSVIDSPINWMPNFLVRDQPDSLCIKHDFTTDCFCFIFDPTYDVGYQHAAATHVFCQFAKFKRFSCVDEFMDDASTTHTNLMALIDRAIELNSMVLALRENIHQ